MTISEAGLALTKAFEGLRLEAYQDAAGIWTVGYGHTGADVRAGLALSEREAEALLREDLQTAEKQVMRLVRTPLEQHQFDALVDFCYNVGCGHFAQSELLARVNARDFPSVVEQFGLWVNIHGCAVSGLVRRRVAEAALFAGDGKNC